MGKKLMYILCQDIDGAGKGIGNKIRAQIFAFQKLGVEVSVSALKRNEKGQYIGRELNECLLQIFPHFRSTFFSWWWRVSYNPLAQEIVSKRYPAVYIRYTHFANPFFIRFLQKLKKNNVRIFLEIPTYPYDSEFKHASWKLKLMGLVERFFRNRLKYSVDRIVTFSREPEIFGVQTICVHNGIDLSSIQQRSAKTVGKEIHLLAVAVVNVWHGYDRLIEGLRNYYDSNPSRRVVLHIVGDGNDQESARYRQLARSYNLNEKVIFHGFKKGLELDHLFQESDCAVGSLGFHRIGVDYVTPIKLSEYCARGIPFFYSGRNDLFDSLSFVLKVPADDSPIDINRIVEFVENIKVTPSDIRQFAEDNLGWEQQLKKVVQDML